jgi:hypothetical protein
MALCEQPRHRRTDRADILGRVLPALPRSSRPLLLIAAFAATLTLTACTAQSSDDSSFEGAKKQAQDVITKLGDFAEDRDSASICDKLLTERLAAEFAKVGGGKCSPAVDRAIRNADYTRLVADSIELNGNDTTATRAVAQTIVQKDGPKRSVVLVRGDAKTSWRIDDVQTTVSKAAATTPSTTPATTTPKSTTP